MTLKCEKFNPNLILFCLSGEKDETIAALRTELALVKADLIRGHPPSPPCRPNERPPSASASASATETAEEEKEEEGEGEESKTTEDDGGNFHLSLDETTKDDEDT